MEIEVGEYVRDRAGNIAKVTKSNNDIFEIKLNSGVRINQFIEFMTKHSKNIIDLIEVGDIVDKSEVYEKGQSDDGQKWVHTYNGKLYYENELVGKTILTKEQYMQNCYKIDTNQQT